MTDRLEEEIARSLAKAAEAVPVGSVDGIAGPAAMRGRVLRRRRAGVAVLVFAGVLAAVPLVERVREEPPGRLEMPPATTPADTGPTARTVPCSTAELPPKDTEYDTFYDPESGVLEYWFGPDNRHFAVDTRNDPSCRADPGMRRLVEHVEETYRESR